MLSFTDQTGRTLAIPEYPKRIISVVPSQTELLFDLGLDEEITGITWFCIHPAAKVKSKTKIGGTKNLKLDLIRSLKPDLIIANKEENEKEQIKTLAAAFPLWISDIHNLDGSVDMIRSLGTICGKVNEANTLINKITINFDKLRPIQKKPGTLYLIWREPYMSIGNDTFIHYIMEKCGFQNICADRGRYPILSNEEIKELNPEIVLLSSEPFPFKEKHIIELKELLPTAKIILVDGEMFSWYGSRLLKAPAYLNGLVGHLDAFNLGS